MNTASPRRFRLGTCRTRSSEVSAAPRTLSDTEMEVPAKVLFYGIRIDRAANVGATRSPEAVQSFADLARACGQLLTATS